MNNPQSDEPDKVAGAGRFNLSAAALKFPQLTLFFILILAIGGFIAYTKLGQREDPDFAFRAMVVRTIWPGATTSQVDQQITDRIEKKLQEIPYFKLTRSYSKPGESLIVLELLDTAPAGEVQGYWYQIRKKLGDIRGTLPPEIIGPFLNDEFGDVFGTIFAFTGDGVSMADLRDRVETVRQELLRLPNVSKIELVGVQDEKIFIELPTQGLANLGIDPQAIAAQLQAQNLIAPGGIVQGASRAVPLRITGQFDSVKEVQELRLNINGRTVRLGDAAKVFRGYVDPTTFSMRFGGKQAIGLSVAMNNRGDVLQLGRDIEATMALIKKDLPIGIEFSKVSDQPKIVKDAVGLFMQSLLEAVAIVLAVSFLSLGFRAGAVVALTIPLVLAATFLAMAYFGIDLHRISTGALIIALGLLVDDAMIAVEMMARKLDEGLDRVSAATYAYTHTAFPMLTGTLITAVGFLPIATAKSATGEYTIAIFQVVTLALLISWVAAVIATPFIGRYVLKERKPGQAKLHNEVYDTRFYKVLRSAIERCMRYRWLTLIVTLGLFVLGGVGMGLTEKQFFPSSNRAEILVEMWLPEGASFKATEEQAKRLEAFLAKDEDIVTTVGYVGNGSPRYYLSLDQQLFRPNFAQFVLLTKGVEGRDRALGRIRKLLDEQFIGIRARAYRSLLGPPVAYPIQFRVMGPDPLTLKRIGEQVASAIRANPATIDTHADWGEQSPAVKIDVDQDKARAIGLSTAQVARAIGGAVSGASVGQLRERDKLIEVVMRAPPNERISLANLKNLQIQTSLGRSVPLAQIAVISEMMEEPIIWRRSRTPSLTIRADLVDGVQAPDIAMQINPQLADMRAALPAGYRIEIGGPAEDSVKAQQSISAGMPMMLAIVLTLLMIQLRKFSTTFMVLITAPLGIVGVAAALLLFQKPFGFVAMLGTIALGGMIMRNTVILVDQIRQDIEAGHPPWEAVLESAVRRFRPICLTAAAAILAMVPLSNDVLWGPMAFSIMGGLAVATVLTMLAVPALYVAWFGIRRPV
jgi:multidrug efflux pump